MRVWLLFSVLALMGLSCVPEYKQVSQEELIAMEMRAVVESITVDFDNRLERGVFANNRGERVGFPIFAEWVADTLEPGVSASVKDSIILCSQYVPVMGDSLFKPKGSRKIKVRQFREKGMDSILIVERWRKEKADRLETRSP